MAKVGPHAGCTLTCGAPVCLLKVLHWENEHKHAPHLFCFSAAASPLMGQSHTGSGTHVDSPVRYIHIKYRLSIYRHFWKILISIWSFLKISISISISIRQFWKISISKSISIRQFWKISISISISIRQFQKYRYRYRYRYGGFGKYRYRYRYR